MGEVIFRLDSLSREENYTPASCPQSGRRKDNEKTHTDDTTPTEFSMTISINNYCFCFFFSSYFYNQNNIRPEKMGGLP